MEDIARRIMVQWRIAYANHLLHGIVAGSPGEVGISMSDLGSLEPPPDCRCLAILVVKACVNDENSLAINSRTSILNVSTHHHMEIITPRTNPVEYSVFDLLA
ncbi:hypothetical protein M9H77_03366 [Catharanthus roseus]|uniref:Uncharacterized protein n=1 Tax=Catharanthus roseus TaxID=4058 RepID=A0ACC0CBI8_CATRO|nr:hypothetical protein M9H77_03366 [Catharanthus roseus]